MNLYDAITENVSKYPERVALKYFGMPVSYRKFGEMIETVASGMYNLGICPGDVVCLALPSTPESIATIYALNKIGAMVSTIDVRLTAPQVVSIVNKLHAKMLFIMNFSIKDIAVEAKGMCVEHIVVMRGCELFPKTVSSWYSFGELFNGRRRAYNSVDKFMHWSDLLALSYGNAPRYEWEADAAQMIFQTSGTTGGSKSVMLTAENINVTVQYARRYYEENKTSTTLCLIPIFAFSGFSATVHDPLCYGQTVIIVPIWKPKDFIKTIAKHKPQFVFSVPSNWDTIYDRSNLSSDLSSLKAVVVAGDVMKPDFEHDLNDFLHHCGCQSDVIKMYGMTETAGVVAITQHQSPYKYQLGFSGCAIDGFKVEIVDGEVCVLHPSRLLGYYNNQEATNNLLRVHEDGKIWLHTGDFGHFDDEGNLYVTGRMKRMLVRFDGTKIFPVEIEDAMLRLPDVLDCAVVGIVDREHPQSSVPVAFCVVKSKGNRTASQIIRYASRELPVHLCPARIVPINKLPVSASGKVDLKKLEKMAME